MKQCDHIVGDLNGFVTQSEVVEKIKSECKSWNYYSKNMISYGGDSKRYKTDHKPIDFVDRIKSHMTHFNYCPYCGEKIDWESIKRELAV